MNTDKMVEYNLLQIPDFTNIVKNNSIDNKYIDISEYTTKSKEKYRIIKYNKNLLSIDLVPIYGLLRSVIINSNNKIVSFAPPKSINTDKFMEKYPKPSSKIIAEEFVEGTMINVFFDRNSGENGLWRIATKSTVDGFSKFFSTSEKTFNAMFTEACFKNNLIISGLNPLFCYSFVLQHPDNRIVLPINKCELYLVDVFKIEQTENNISIFHENLDSVRQFGFWNNTFVKFPERYTFDSYSELIEKYASANTSYNIVGVMIKNLETGERCKIRNPIYEEVKQLRGNQSKLQFQYLHLRQTGKVNEFLKYYPEMRKELSLYRDQVHLFTNTLYSNYISCYVKKEKPLREYNGQYRTHMFKLHEKYINELMPNKQYVTNTIVINYVNNLPPALLMFSLNYNMRKQNIDTSKI